jgi:hypothetical protein
MMISGVHLVVSDPSTVPGLAAIYGERALRQATGDVWVKTGTLDTDWTPAATFYSGGGGGGGGYSTIKNNGTPVTQRSALNLSAQFSAADDPGNAETDLAIVEVDHSLVTGLAEAAQDAVGGILTDTAEIDFTYNDAAPSISAVVGAIAQSKVTNLTTDLAARLTFIGLQVFTSSGTYTPTAGMKQCLVISTGAGGGGGGADCTGAADAAAGAGGGAGGTCIELFSAAAIGASQTVTINAAGTAGTNTGGGGGNGGDTTFGGLHTANGGTGGAGAATGTANVRTTAGGAGGVPTGGLANVTGGDGDNGVALLTLDATDGNEVAFATGGHGGASFWGDGGRGGQNAQDAAAADSTAGSQAGVAGAAFGSGGGGGAVLNTGTGVTGGAGAGGFCLVLEFG